MNKSLAQMRGGVSAGTVVLIGAAMMFALAGAALLLAPTDRKDGEIHGLETIEASGGVIYSTRLSDIGGRELTLGRWSDKLLVLNFWATWCAPCKEEMPLLERLQRRHGSSGLQIVGIAADSRENVAKFAESMGVSYPLLPDEAGAMALARRLGNRLGLLPYTVIVEPGGRVIMTRMGVIDERQMDTIALKYVKKS